MAIDQHAAILVLDVDLAGTVIHAAIYYYVRCFGEGCTNAGLPCFVSVAGVVDVDLGCDVGIGGEAYSIEVAALHYVIQIYLAAGVVHNQIINQQGLVGGVVDC